MIKEVSPNDVLKLYEIDTRVWVWLQGYEVRSVKPTVGDDIGGLTFRYHKAFTAKDKGKPLSRNLMIDSEARFYPNGDLLKRFTTSRDALKIIRPYEYLLHMTEHYDGSFQCVMTAKDDTHREESPILFKEELAELCATMQVIAHKRQQLLNTEVSRAADQKP
ncbi:hypothetical protein K3G63_04780 [Hymenobacter sp. HSC-4F20]|nr:hypothetical protein [Hymenobacter sp. HSC-4F20]